MFIDSVHMSKILRKEHLFNKILLKDLKIFQDIRITTEIKKHNWNYILFLFDERIKLEKSTTHDEEIIVLQIK